MGSKANTANKGGESFAGVFGAVMAMAGMAIGLGNVWRFPYMTGANGGGAFVLAYLVCVVICVIPMAIIEAGYGKEIGKGLMEAYEAATHKPFLSKIIGGICSLVYFTMNFYFVPIMAVCFYFIYVCLVGLWNTVPADQIYDQGMANAPLMIALIMINVLVIGVVVYLGVDKGIEACSKVMVPLMFVFFIIVIIFGAMNIEGIGAGYDFYLHPDFSVWTHPSLWVAAMGQALFSIGVGPGCVLIYGSHLKKGDDVALTMTSVALLDTSIAVIAGMAMLPACVGMGIEPDQGSKLIFVILPSLFQRLPGGRIMGVLCFTAIWFAAVTSAVAQTEIPTVTFMHGLNKSRHSVCIVLSIVTAVAGILAVVMPGFTDFWSNFSGNYGFIVTAGVGAIVYGWIYGTEKIMDDAVNPTSDLRFGPWFAKYVKFIVIPILVIIMLNSIFPFLG